MASPGVPQVPPQLKAIQHYMKTAAEHDKRDPVVSYWCRLYALQKGMEIDKKSPECRVFLTKMMDFLEEEKTRLKGEEAVHSEMVGQAHMENYSLKVFLYADNEDRAGRFNKNVVKSFYTAGMLFDVLTVFGDLSDDIDKNRRYAKWKAAYIHRCLKNGETPVPGPIPEGDDGEEGSGMPSLPPSMPYPGPSGTASSNLNLPTGPPYPPAGSMPSPSAGGAHAPPTTPQDMPGPSAYQPAGLSQPAVPAYTDNTWKPTPNPSGTQLNPDQFQRAMKLCKYASSALQYEDSKTAIDNLQKCLQLLTTGKES